MNTTDFAPFAAALVTHPATIDDLFRTGLTEDEARRKSGRGPGPFPDEI